MLRTGIAGLAVLWLCSSPVIAGPIEDAVVTQLKAQGYTSVAVSRTWLGRIIIEGKLAGVSREIVLNPLTGEILRDYSQSDTVVADQSDHGSGQTGASAARATGETQPAVAPHIMEPAFGIASDPVQ